MMKKPLKKIRGETYANDIESMRKPTIWGLVIVVFISLLLLAGSSFDEQKTYDKYQSYQEIVAVANKDFNADQRQKLVEWLPNASNEDLDESGFLKEREAPKTFLEVFLDSLVGACIAALFVYSVVVTAIYCLSREVCFYFADLPFRSFWGWFALIICFVAWPYFIVSRILFWRFKKRQRDKAIRNAVKLPEITPLFKRDDFIKFYRDRLPFYGRLKRAEAKLTRSEDDVRCLGEKLESLTEELRVAQAAMSHNLAEVNALRSQKNTNVANQQYEQQAAHDFAEIKAMRGVRQIYVDHYDNLKITVRATYEHAGLVYDAGDFEIKIGSNHLTARQFRAVGDRYNYGECFCFGDSKYAIDDYVTEGRIVEAVELAIESLNHINKEDVAVFLQRSKVIAS